MTSQTYAFGDARLIRIPTVEDARGSLVHIDSEKALPFEVRRTYFTHGVPEGAVRGGHAHRRCEELLVAAAGTFHVSLHNGVEEAALTLDDPSLGLYIPAMMWRVLDRFSSGAVCLVFSSLPFDEADYYRDFNAFKIGLGNADGSVS